MGGEQVVNWVIGQITGRWGVIRDHWSLCLAIAVGGLVIGWLATSTWDAHEIRTAYADRDIAQNCRRSGSDLPPCPLSRDAKVIYKPEIKYVATPDASQVLIIDDLQRRLAAAGRDSSIRNPQNDVATPPRTTTPAKNGNSAGKRGNALITVEKGSKVKLDLQHNDINITGDSSFTSTPPDVQITGSSNKIRKSGNGTVFDVRPH